LVIEVLHPTIMTKRVVRFFFVLWLASLLWTQGSSVQSDAFRDDTAQPAADDNRLIAAP
jgi:hypothetical protein